MKITIGIHHFPPRYTAGAEMQAYRTAAGLAARGHEIQVYCVEHIDRGAPAGGLAVEDTEFDGIPVRRMSLDLRGAGSFDPSGYDNPVFGEAIAEGLLRSGADIYHQIGGYLLTGNPLIHARRLKVPTVLTLVDFWYLCPRTHFQRSNGELSSLPIDPVRCVRCLKEESRRYRIPGAIAPGFMKSFWALHKREISWMQTRNDLLMRVLSQVDAIISPSKFLQQVHIQAGVDPMNIRHIRQGIASDGKPVAEPKSEKRDVLALGFMGQISSHKGVHVLIDAVGRMPRVPVTVDIFGDEKRDKRYFESLRRKATGDKRVAFRGHFSGSESLSNVLSSIDVLVVPSINYENSPNVILEAFAHGVPVVASRLGGMQELVQHERNGLLFEYGNSTELAVQLQRLVKEPGLLGRLRKGVGTVDSVEQEISTLENTYRALEGI